METFRSASGITVARERLQEVDLGLYNGSAEDIEDEKKWADETTHRRMDFRKGVRGPLPAWTLPLARASVDGNSMTAIYVGPDAVVKPTGEGGRVLPLFKAFKAPSVGISISTEKDGFVLGETIAGDLLVTSQEDLVAKGIRVELRGVEKLKGAGEPTGDQEDENRDTRLYSSLSSFTQRGDIVEFPMHKTKAQLSERLDITRGFNQQFPFRLTIPANLGPSFQGERQDGQWLERTWTLQAIVAVGGRPDVEVGKEIQVLRKEPTPPPVSTPGPAIGGPMMFCRHCGKQIAKGAVFCNFCGGRQGEPSGTPPPPL